eukprot:9496499-Pyramimonas_sp.AAC.2
MERIVEKEAVLVNHEINDNKRAWTATRAIGEAPNNGNDICLQKKSNRAPGRGRGADGAPPNGAMCEAPLLIGAARRGRGADGALTGGRLMGRCVRRPYKSEPRGADRALTRR